MKRPKMNFKVLFDNDTFLWFFSFLFAFMMWFTVVNTIYTSTDRTGDLTLCDLTSGISPQEKQLGMSLLLVNTAKGAQIFDSLPLHRRRFDLAEAVAADQALRSPAPVSVDRTKFFDALEQEPFRQVCARFLSLMQPRARAARPLKELLHIPFKKRKDK